MQWTLCGGSRGSLTMLFPLCWLISLLHNTGGAAAAAGAGALGQLGSLRQVRSGLIPEHPMLLETVLSVWRSVLTPAIFAHCNTFTFPVSGLQSLAVMDSAAPPQSQRSCAAACVQGFQRSRSATTAGHGLNASLVGNKCLLISPLPPCCK